MSPGIQPISPEPPETGPGDPLEAVTNQGQERPFFDLEIPNDDTDPTSESEPALDPHIVHDIATRKELTHRTRAAQFCHYAHEVFAARINADPGAVASAKDLEATYYDLAAYLIANRTAKQDVEIVLELLEEEVAPFRKISPLFIAEGIEKMEFFHPDANTACMMTKLWLVDYLDISLPSSFDEMRQYCITHQVSRRVGQNILSQLE